MAMHRHIPLDESRRIICISDIHGDLVLLRRLLEKIGYTDGEQLMLLGDFSTKGDAPQATLEYIMALSRRPNVYALRGNCDWGQSWLTAAQEAWQESLPHILESDSYIFVHGGLPSMDFDAISGYDCMKVYNFMELAQPFPKWVITGHWPVNNYCHGIVCQNPIVNHEKRIIAIDGGCSVNHHGGQLNAFIIENGRFSHAAVDHYAPYRVPRTQAESGGAFSITYIDRQIERLEYGEPFSLCRHIATGRVMRLPNETMWTDAEGALCIANCAMDHYLGAIEGECVSLVSDFGERVLIKRDGVIGWLDLA